MANSMFDKLAALIQGPKPSPEMEAAIATRQIMDPEGMKGVKVVPGGMMMRASNGLQRLMGIEQPAIAQHMATLPWQNTIRYDPALLEEAMRRGEIDSPQALLEHEVQHARDRKKMGYLPYLKASMVDEHKFSYGAGPLEGAAFEAEANTAKKYRTRDIPLRGK